MKRRGWRAPFWNDEADGDAGRAPDGTHAPFPSQTQWTELVDQAGNASSPHFEAALDRLCQVYWFPLYAFVRRQGKASHDAQDLIQGFFVHLLEGNVIRQARRDKGRFRTFLIHCLKHFMIDENRIDRAVQRGGRASHFSINEAEAEEKYGRLPVIPATADEFYDRTWAASVLEEALRQLQDEYAQRGDIEGFQEMKSGLSGELASEEYPAAATRLGISLGAFQTNLSRLRGRYRKLVRRAVIETLNTTDDTEINAEIEHLLAAWAARVNASS